MKVARSYQKERIVGLVNRLKAEITVDHWSALVTHCKAESNSSTCFSLHNRQPILKKDPTKRPTAIQSVKECDRFNIGRRTRHPGMLYSLLVSTTDDASNTAIKYFSLLQSTTPTLEILLPFYICQVQLVWNTGKSVRNWINLLLISAYSLSQS